MSHETTKEMAKETAKRPALWRCWLHAIRPKTLFAAVSPVVLGIAVAVRNEVFDLLPALAALLCALLIQIGTNFANEYWDWKKGADRDTRKGPPRATSLGWISPGTMLAAVIATFGATALLGSFLVWHAGWPILLIGILSILCGIFYTAGPFALAYLGLGEIFVLFFFGPIACAGTYYVQTLNLDITCILLGFAAGSYSAALLTVNNLRDIRDDIASKKNTLAARFGERFARIEFLVFLICPALLAPLAAWLDGYTILWTALLFGLPVFWAWRTGKRFMETQVGPVLNRFLGETGGVSMAFTLLVSLIWIFIR
ncbi:MAG: 1,4-dihydroxy-2-naphthoate polyprenyltransferase [Chthoniobacterales bacterium]